MKLVIPTHNEKTAFALLDILIKTKKQDDEIIILDDYSEQSYLEEIKKYTTTIIQHKLNFDFSEHCNYIHKFIVPNEWICLIASDELIDENFMFALHNKIKENPVDIFYLPRYNSFYNESDNTTLPELDWEAVIKASVIRNNNEFLINAHYLHQVYPDYQGRVYRNNGIMKWQGKVHETIVGNISGQHLVGKEFTIRHHRSWQKINSSGAFYKEIMGK